MEVLRSHTTRVEEIHYGKESYRGPFVIQRGDINNVSVDRALDDHSGTNFANVVLDRSTIGGIRVDDDIPSFGRKVTTFKNYVPIDGNDHISFT